MWSQLHLRDLRSLTHKIKLWFAKPKLLRAVSQIMLDFFQKVAITMWNRGQEVVAIVLPSGHLHPRLPKICKIALRVTTETLLSDKKQVPHLMTYIHATGQLPMVSTPRRPQEMRFGPHGYKKGVEEWFSVKNIGTCRLTSDLLSQIGQSPHEYKMQYKKKMSSGTRWCAHSSMLLLTQKVTPLY